MEGVNIKKELIEKLKCRRELLWYISMLHEMHYYKDELADANMKDFDLLFDVKKGAHPMKYYYLEDELLKILKK